MERVTHAMRRERWKRIICECNQSEMKKKDWLELNHISPKLYYRWHKNLRMETGSELILAGTAEVSLPRPDFAGIDMHNSYPSESTAVIHGNEVDIEVREEISDEFLMRILKAAGNA